MFSIKFIIYIIFISSKIGQQDNEFDKRPISRENKSSPFVAMPLK